MRYLFLLLFVIVCTGVESAVAQQNGTVRGVVRDETGEPVQYLSVVLEGSVLGTMTREEGRFELTGIKPGVYTLRVSGVGYAALRREVDLQSQSLVELALTIQSAPGMLGEVVVSASRSVETLEETPASIYVVDTKRLESQMKISPNVANILAALVPGLALNTNTTSNTGQTLRGRNVLVMVDGIPQSTPLRAGGRDIRSIDPAAIQRIEVVKGATAVYGNGADGGLINYITKVPESSKPFSASTSLANTGMLAHAGETFGGRLTQQITGKIDSWDYVVTGTYERTGVFKDAEGDVLSPTYGLGETDMYNVFLKSGYDLSSDHRVELMYNYFSSGQSSAYIEQTGKFLETPTVGVEGERKGEKEGTRYNHNVQLKYYGTNLIGSTGLDAALYTQQFSTLYGYSSFFENGGQSTIRSDKKGARVNLHTPVSFAEGFTGNIVYGVDYLTDITSQPLVDGRTWVPEIDLRNAAPYAQFQMSMPSDLVFKAGYRYDNVTVDVPDFTQVRDAQGQGGNFIRGGSIKFGASTFNAGLRYIGLDAFKPFVSFSQGFSIIDIGRYVRAAKENDIAAMDIKPVIVNSYEAGFHSNLGIVSLSGAYFVSTSKLGANLVARPDNSGFEIQRAPERIQGVEAIVDVFITNYLQWGASAAYSEGKVDLNDNGSYDDATDTYLNGTRIAPTKVTSYINVQPLDKLTLNLQWIYSGSRDHFKPKSNGAYGFGEGPVSSFNIFNLTAGYRFTEKISANVGVENLLNTTYYLPIAYWYGTNANYIRANGARYQLQLSVEW